MPIKVRYLGPESVFTHRPPCGPAYAVGRSGEWIGDGYVFIKGQWTEVYNKEHADWYKKRKGSFEVKRLLMSSKKEEKKEEPKEEPKEEKKEEDRKKKIDQVLTTRIPKRERKSRR